MIRKRSAATALALTLLAVSVPAYGNPAADTDIAGRVAEHLDATGTPGAALAVTTAGATTYTHAWGVDGDERPVTPDTPFLWGSVAKPVTATVALSLGVDPAAPVGRYLPEFTPTWRGEPAEVTVGQLMSHTSGITSMAATDAGDNGPGAVSRVAARLYDYELDTAPGEAHVYTSSNYLLLGAVIEAVTGREFAEVLTETVLTPAGMTHAVTGPDDPLPPGHAQYFGRPFSFDDPFDRSGLPYGYLGGSITDLAAYARFALTGPAVMTEPQPGTDGRYGLGWSLGRLPGTDEPMVWHSGATRGYQAVLILLPAKGIAVALLQNTYGEARAEQLLNAGFDAALMSAGYRPGSTYGPNALLHLPWAASLAALTVLAWAAWRAFRPRVRRRWLALIWAAVALVPLALPASAGADWRTMWFWTPDAAWTLAACTVAAVLAALVEALRPAAATRAARRS
ncbi:serine hydrolase domain-containing protein [Phytomonospora sp. NPDC050363]|uniref:serine hydrolase domain-containing protein n=1 Tax=Phytomonospora sp. NPDC050363 TaxID=3155642 RepID=UPI0033D9C543